MHGSCAGTYAGTGNNAPLIFGSGTVITMQSLVGELNTVIDLGGGSRAFDFNSPPALTTLSGVSAASFSLFPWLTCTCSP